MKTAVSIPDPVFEAADTLARRLGMARSELYATAVAEYLERHRAAGIRERLDAVYAAADDAARLESVFAAPGPTPVDEW